MKNYELRWGKSPPRSKVLAQSAAVFSATPSAELKLVVLGLSILGRESPLKKTVYFEVVGWKVAMNHLKIVQYGNNYKKNKKK